MSGFRNLCIGDDLTKTEKAVLIAVNLGWTNNEIADMMVVSYETIRTHCAHIKRKIGDQWPIRKGAGHGGRGLKPGPIAEGGTK